MKATVLMGLLIAGCGAQAGPVASATPLPARAEPAPISTEEAVHYVAGDVMPWCFTDTEAVFGGRCGDDQAACERSRSDTIERDFVHMVGELQKRGIEFEVAKRTAADGTTKRWAACTPAMAAVCLQTMQIVSGMTARLCFNRLSDCRDAITELRPNADYRVEDHCTILRWKQ